MNPLGHPAENVPLEGRYDGLPGLLGGFTAIPYTTLNMTPEPPKDHIIWSLCCFLYSNPCCLGLAALIFSIKVRTFYTQVLNEEERQRLCQNMAGALKGAQLFIQKRMVENLKAVDPDYGNRVQSFLNNLNAEAQKDTSLHVYSRPGAIAASSKM